MRALSATLFLCLPALLMAFLAPVTRIQSSSTLAINTVPKAHDLLSERPIRRNRGMRWMSEESDAAAAEEARKLDLSNNMRSRKGRTTDEDGKSNIWAIESKTEQEVTGGSGALVVVGVLVAFVGALALLPTLQFPTFD